LLRFPIRALLATLRIPTTWPLLHQVVHAIHTVYHTDLATPHSTGHDILPVVFLISRQVVPYQTSDGTCCSEVSTPKIRSIADSSTTCHDGINHLHPSNHFSNHNIDPHMGKLHHDGWKAIFSHEHKPKFNIRKDERLV
jgi:hypothetical protein